MDRAPRIAIVGHTNTGKTSLMRTLMRDAGFGEVSSRPSTTRHVEGARLLADGEVLVELYDTPGLEDPIALLELLEAIDSGEDERLDGVARVERFLSSQAASGRFEQEAKVLRQMLASDAALYVVDARDPVLAKHRDELAILAACATPLLPVLNFVRDAQAREAAWREALARLGLHVVVRFDAVAPEREGEKRLYEKLATLLETFLPTFERLVAHREREFEARRTAALRLLANLLVDVAALRVTVRLEDDVPPSSLLSGLHERVRAREQQCVDALLALYRFGPDDVDAATLPLIGGRWEEDLFDPATLRTIGVKLGSGVAAGAAAGVGIDLMFGGLTLGAAAALGALAGGGWQAVQHFGGRLQDRLQGKRSVSVDEAILQVLATRQLFLLRALEARGHAALAPVPVMGQGATAGLGAILGERLRQARINPQWSRLSPAPRLDAARQAEVDALAEALRASLEAR